MNGLLNAIVKLLLGWSKLIFTWIWSLFQSGGGGFASYAREHWVMILIMVLLGGWLLDQAVWMFRFRPYRDWMRAFQRLKRGPRGIFSRDKTREADGDYHKSQKDIEHYGYAEEFPDDEYYEAEYEDDGEPFLMEPDFHEERRETNERRFIRSESREDIARSRRDDARYSDEEYDEAYDNEYEDFNENEWEEYDEEEARPSLFKRLTSRVSGILRRRNSREEMYEGNEEYTEYDEEYYDEYYEQDEIQDDAAQTRVFNALPQSKGPLRENWGRIEIGNEESLEELDERRRWLTAFSKPVKNRIPEKEEVETVAFEEEMTQKEPPSEPELPKSELPKPDIPKPEPHEPEPEPEPPVLIPEPAVPIPEPPATKSKPEPKRKPEPRIMKAEPEPIEAINEPSPEPPKRPPRKLPRQNKETAKPNPYKNISAASTGPSRTKSSTPILDSLLAENKAKKERMRDEQENVFNAADPELKPVLDHEPGDDVETLRPSKFGPRDIDMPDVALDKNPDDDVVTMRPKPPKK